MDEREGFRCAWCRSNLRSRQLAAAIVGAVNERAGTRSTWLRSVFADPRAQALDVAEINSAGNLHRYLARCKRLRYSEYGGRERGIPSEDLHALSYADASFDLVITSDTLEHVPDVDRALREIFRVLRPGGAHVFSVPVVSDRPTRRRAILEGGEVRHLLPPSFHGSPLEARSDHLVFWEFGGDFTDRCEAAGFQVDVVRDERNPALITFFARRPG